MLSIQQIIVLLLVFFIAVMAYVVVRAEEAENRLEKNQDQQIKDYLKRT